jgi:hypothetical protein
MPAPQIVQIASADWILDTSDTRNSTSSLSLVVGDVVIACGSTNNPAHTLTFSGGTNTTWTQRRTSNANSRASIWTCTVSANETVTPTVTRSGGAVSSKLGAIFYHFRGSTGLGVNVGSTGTGTAATVINTTGATYPSVIAILATDGNGGVDSENPATWLTNAGGFQVGIEEYADVGWTVTHSGYHDSVTQGTYSIGHSFPNNQFYDIIALELWGAPVPPVATVGWLSA